MNIYATDIMTIFFILLCCLCTFLVILLAFVFYVLGSSRVRSALFALSLIKTVIDIGKDLTGVFKTVKKTSKKTKKNTNSIANVVDAEFREKKSKN